MEKANNITNMITVTPVLSVPQHTKARYITRSQFIDLLREPLTQRSMACGGDFSGMDLRGINLRGQTLFDVTFEGADLRGADFRATNNCEISRTMIAK